ncbi:hypothetical protein LJR098_003326 [Rhizobium sp. LjRoot98]|uniref:hypothetical protein n=1 Tax=Rhizobium sp. LjRoot98 TaxID=3342345 RepID=UPI003ECCA8F5
MPATDHHPIRTKLIRRDVIVGPAAERQLFFRANAAMERFRVFENLCGLLDADGRPTIDVSSRAEAMEAPAFGEQAQIDRAFEGTIYIHFGALPIYCLDSNAMPTGAYVSAIHTDRSEVDGQIVFVSADTPWQKTVGLQPHEILAAHVDIRVYDYFYGANANYVWSTDGQAGAFMNAEQTEDLIPVVSIGVKIAVEIAALSLSKEASGNRTLDPTRDQGIGSIVVYPSPSEYSAEERLPEFGTPSI